MMPSIPKTSGYVIYSHVLAKIADMLTVLLCGALSFWAHFHFSIFLIERYQWLTLTASLLIVVIFSQIRVYESWRGSVRVGLVVRLTRGYLLLAVIIFSYMFLSEQGERYSRQWLSIWLFSSLSLTILIRVVAYKLLHRLRSKGMNGKSVALIGNYDSCLDVYHSLCADPSAGFFVTHARVVKLPEREKEIFANAEVRQLSEESMQFETDEIWICLPLTESDQLGQIMDKLSLLSANIRYLPDMKDFRLINYKVSYVASHYALDITFSRCRGCVYGLNGWKIKSSQRLL